MEGRGAADEGPRGGREAWERGARTAGNESYQHAQHDRDVHAALLVFALGARIVGGVVVAAARSHGELADRVLHRSRRARSDAELCADATLASGFGVGSAKTSSLSDVHPWVAPRRRGRNQ